MVRSWKPRSSAVRSLSFETENALHDPQPSTPLEGGRSDPLSDQECEDTDEEYLPPTKQRRTEDASGKFSPIS